LNSPHLPSLQTVLSQWFLADYRFLTDHELYGSPERTLKRYLIESSGSDRFILDQVNPSTLSRKIAMAENLERLYQINPTLPVNPYLKNVQNLFITEEKTERWMLSRYLTHLPLDRRHYWKDSWRGKAMTAFLLDLYQSAKKIPPVSIRSWDPPLYRYIPDLMVSIERFQPETTSLLKPILKTLQPFLACLPEMKTSFQHGDFHPLNILWGEKTIIGVIDWEFSGLKPRLYDVANMVGCLGMEKPEALLEPMASELITGFYRAGESEKMEWDYFIELMTAIRFGWLSEWLRKKDTEMVELEITYMHFLLQYKTELFSRWGF